MNQGLTVFGFDLGAWLDRLPPWGLPAIILYGALVAALLIPVAVALGRARAGWGWALLLLLPGIGLLVLAIMFMARVLPRARWSPALGLLLLLPPLSIFFAWIFAFAAWKKAYRPLAVEDLSQPPHGSAKPPPAPPPQPAPPPEPARKLDAEMDVKTGVRRAAPAEPTAAPAAAAPVAPAPAPIVPARDERTAPPAASPAGPAATPVPAAAIPAAPIAPATPPAAAPSAAGPAAGPAAVAPAAPPPLPAAPSPAPSPAASVARNDARTVQMSGPAEGGRAWRLIGANDRSAALEFTVTERDLRNAEAGILVGRSRGAGIVIADESVSRNHARFVIGEGALAVEDLDSMNGTWVNGQKLEANAPVKLATEAIVEFGKIRLLVTDA